MSFVGLLEKFKIIPNFWASEEYFQKAGFEQVQNGELLTVMSGDWSMFPGLNTQTGTLVWKHDKIWSDFPGEGGPDGYEAKFLDYEYVYDPQSFTHMDGKAWQVFRKNSRKFPRRFAGQLTYDWARNYPFDPAILPQKLESLLVEWASDRDEAEEIHDDLVMEEYLLGGENRKILWDSQGAVYGVNIWDSNYFYVNFRFCFCLSEDFLSEYMRLLFYTDPDITNTGKLVNDGGVLDNPHLKAFKDKLNPLRMREVKSWERRK